MDLGPHVHRQWSATMPKIIVIMRIRRSTVTVLVVIIL